MPKLRNIRFVSLPAKLWPDAILSSSGIILGLAKVAAKNVLQRPSGKKREPSIIWKSRRMLQSA